MEKRESSDDCWLTGVFNFLSIAMDVENKVKYFRSNVNRVLIVMNLTDSFRKILVSNWERENSFGILFYKENDDFSIYSFEQKTLNVSNFSLCLYIIWNH